MKIGIPRSLLYYDNYPYWETFFQSLGYELILSNSTTKSVLDMGVLACVQDSCIPVKLYHGHVLNLIGRCDKVFVPRFRSIERREFVCPKLIGLPEMLRGAGVIEDKEMLVIDIDGYKNSEERHKGFVKYAIREKKNKKEVNELIKNCELSQLKYRESQLVKLKQLENSNTKIIAIIGHPYLIYDTYINMGLAEKLKKVGYEVLYPENIPIQNINYECNRLPKRIFLSYGRRLFGSAMDMMRNYRVDGIIFLTSFGCGVDALIGELLEIYNNRYFNIPYTTLVLDEHTGQGGVKTRIEAFLDMIRWREKDGTDISPHGPDVYSCKSFF